MRTLFIVPHLDHVHGLRQIIGYGKDLDIGVPFASLPFETYARIIVLGDPYVKHDDGARRLSPINQATEKWLAEKLPRALIAKRGRKVEYIGWTQ